MRNDEPLPVVIVHRDEPERCVRTAQAFLAQDVPVQLTVVDNGSSAEAVRHIAGSLPEADVLVLGDNRGFGPAANVGLNRWLERGPGDWAAVAAHDALPEPGCIRRLLDGVATRPHAGLASAVYGDPMKPVVDRYFGGILVAAERDSGWEEAGHPHGTLMVANVRGGSH